MRPRGSAGWLTLALLCACADSDGSVAEESTTETEAGDGDGDPTSGDGDGDGDPTTGDGDGDGDGDPTTGDGDGDGDGDNDPGSLGCGLTPTTPDDAYVQIDVDGVTRQFVISYAPDYDPNLPSSLYVGLHGRDYSGSLMQGYLGLETEVTPLANEIFVYPDALEREFVGWGTMIGWQLGPGAADTPAAGDEDLIFLDAMLDYMLANYCIDTSRVFATGQSWGGDISSVLACVRGDRYRAAVPVATNGTYQLLSPPVECTGEVAMWVMHGENDEAIPPAQGDLVHEYWRDHNGCDPSSAVDLRISVDGEPEDCVEYTDCTTPMRWCSYDAQYGHQIPFAYYAVETMAFFRSL